MAIQAPRELPGVVREAVRASGRQVTAMIGPYDQAVGACAAIGRSPLSLERELLFAVDLADLEVPGALRSGDVVCRPPRREELDLLAEWRAGFLVGANRGGGEPRLES